MTVQPIPEESPERDMTTSQRSNSSPSKLRVYTDIPSAKYIEIEKPVNPVRESRMEELMMMIISEQSLAVLCLPSRVALMDLTRNNSHGPFSGLLLDDMHDAQVYHRRYLQSFMASHLQ